MGTFLCINVIYFLKSPLSRMRWEKKLKEEMDLKPVTDEEFEELLNDRPKRRKRKK